MNPPRVFLPLSLFAVLLASACAPALTSSPAAEVTVTSALPAATSRGPNLEATDPTTVNLASGGLQLIEFFRFT